MVFRPRVLIPYVNNELRRQHRQYLQNPRRWTATGPYRRGGLRTIRPIVNRNIRAGFRNAALSRVNRAVRVLRRGMRRRRRR